MKSFILAAALTLTAFSASAMPVATQVTTAVQIAALVPAGIDAGAKAAITRLLANADAAETAGDDVLARTWRQLALKEVDGARMTLADAR